MTDLSPPDGQHHEPDQMGESAHGARSRLRVVLGSVGIGAAVIAAVLVAKFTYEEFVLDERDPDNVVDAFVEAFNDHDAATVLARVCDDAPEDDVIGGATRDELQQTIDAFDEADRTIQRRGTLTEQSDTGAAAELAFTSSTQGSIHYTLTLTRETASWCVSGLERTEELPRDPDSSDTPGDVLGGEGTATVDDLLDAIREGEDATARDLVCDEAVDATTSDIEEVSARDSTIRSPGSRVTETAVVVELTGSLGDQSAEGSAGAHRAGDRWCVHTFNFSERHTG